MANVFFESCKVCAAWPASAAKMKAYMQGKLGIQPAGCCRSGHTALSAEDTAWVICNNCAAIIEENTHARIAYVWKLVDADADFPFPDYGGETVALQDCWTAKERTDVQGAVRSILKKMNIKVEELPENRENTRFCGEKLLKPCLPANARLAPVRYVQKGAHMFTPMDEADRKAALADHCTTIEAEKVVCWCKTCTDGITLGGKQGIHLLQLVFPAE